MGKEDLQGKHCRVSLAKCWALGCIDDLCESLHNAWPLVVGRCVYDSGWWLVVCGMWAAGLLGCFGQKCCSDLVSEAQVLLQASHELCVVSMSLSISMP